MHRRKLSGLASVVLLSCCLPAMADGKAFAPKVYKERPYTGSVEEKSQEAIIVFHAGEGGRSAMEDLILKVSVKGDVDTFGWVIPFPKEPKAAKEDAVLFEELFAYVEARQKQLSAMRPKAHGTKDEGMGAEEKVEVLSRRTVGSYDVAIVREREKGALNQWLDDQGFQTVPEGETVIEFYRKKGYVFACIKVSDAELSTKRSVDLHPLRFTFETGGRDASYYPMKMTGLQKEPFDINLYVLYRFWLNDRLNQYGYVHRGFSRRYRDWDTPKCVANGGKAYSAPQTDPFLRSLAHKLPNVAKLFQKLYPGRKYYLTNIQLHVSKPSDLLDWADDLWLFPYYTNRKFVPYDARKGGVAASAWE